MGGKSMLSYFLECPHKNTSMPLEITFYMSLCLWIVSGHESAYKTRLQAWWQNDGWLERKGGEENEEEMRGYNKTFFVKMLLHFFLSLH